jgi:hypothetical protein
VAANPPDFPFMKTNFGPNDEARLAVSPMLRTHSATKKVATTQTGQPGIQNL